MYVLDTICRILSGKKDKLIKIYAKCTKVETKMALLRAKKIKIKRFHHINLKSIMYLFVYNIYLCIYNIYIYIWQCSWSTEVPRPGIGPVPQ